MLGIIPVYLDMTKLDGPEVEVRHWSFEFPFIASCALFDMFCFIWTLLDPEATPSFPIKITGRAQ